MNQRPVRCQCCGEKIPAGLATEGRDGNDYCSGRCARGVPR